jgi:hypothetical protein
MIGRVLLVVVAGTVQPQKWELPLVSHSDTMYTDLSRIERLAPHVYRAWSRYVYTRPMERGTEALVQKDYDCEQGRRRVVSAMFYDANHTVTWESKEPGRWIPVTRHKGRRQWEAVCAAAEGGLLTRFLSWLKRTLS